MTAVRRDEPDLTAVSTDRMLLARHGATDWNLAGRRQGRADTTLNALGKEQAGQLARFAQEAGVDALYSSPARRCRQTAAVVARVTGLDSVVLDELIEVDLGVTTGLTSQQLEAAYGEHVAHRASNKLYVPWPGGESYADALERASPGVRCIISGGHQLPLVVSHEMMVKVILVLTLGLDSDPKLERRLPHGHLYDVDLAEGRAVLVPLVTP